MIRYIISLKFHKQVKDKIKTYRFIKLILLHCQIVNHKKYFLNKRFSNTLMKLVKTKNYKVKYILFIIINYILIQNQQQIKKN